MPEFTLTITRGGDGVWAVDWSPHAEVGDVIFGVTMATCAAATSMSTDPRDIIARVTTLLDSPDIHIHETWRPEPPKK